MLFRPGLELPASPFTIISKVSSWNAAATPSSLIRDFSNSVVTTTFWPDPARCAREIKRFGSNVPSAMYASPSGPPVPSTLWKSAIVRPFFGATKLLINVLGREMIPEPWHKRAKKNIARGESTHSQTAQLLKLLDTYGPAELREAIREALEHGTPRVSSVAFLLRKYQRSRQRRAPAPVDLSQHPELAALDMQPQNLEVYDELTKQDDDEK